MDALQTLIRLIATCLLLILFNSPVWATFEQFAGTYSGTSTNTFVGCPTNGTLVGSWNGTLVDQGGDIFGFNGTDDATFVGTVDIAGTNQAISATVLIGIAGTIGGSNSGAFFTSFTFTLSADFNSYTITSSGDLGGGCTFTNSVSGSRVVATLVIIPEVTPSSTVTDAILFNTQIQSQVSDISKHITGALAGRRFFGGPRVSDNQFKMEGATGLSAGGGFAIPYGVWGSYAYSDYDNDLSSTAFDGNSHSFLGGIDFAFWENTILGVAFGYDNGDIDTTFNGGHQDTDSYTIAPYFGALLSDTLSLDFNVGYSRVDYDQFRTSTLLGTTTIITSSPNSDRWFGALNLNGVTYYDNWILGARVGALFAKSVIDSYTESDGTVVVKSRNKVGEGSIAGDIAYTYKNFEPFLNLSYQYDFQLKEISVTTGPQPSNDRDDILMTAGVRYFGNNGISGNLEYTKRFERDDFDEDRISLTLRVDF